MPFFSYDPFIECLQQCAGGSWTLFEAQQQLDALVLQPLPQSSVDPGTDAALFLDFLANVFHRRLLHCFVGNNVPHLWTLEALMKQARPPSPLSLLNALERCVFWQIALENSATSTWQGHPRLIPLNNLGWTFEWVIQALLEREYHALVRRHVILGEVRVLGEIDVLALFANGQSLLIECKSSSKGLTDRQLDRFVAKAQGFPATYALLIIDTDDFHQMEQRLGQFGQAMMRAFGDGSVGPIQYHAGSNVVCLRRNLYVADTGGGIISSLQAILTKDADLP